MPRSPLFASLAALLTGCGLTGCADETADGVFAELSAVDEGAVHVLPFTAASLQVAADGHVWLADLSSRRVVELDGTSGAVRRSLGQDGSGPGEMRAPGALAVTPGGVIALTDARLLRLTVWNADGSLNSTFPLSGFPLEMRSDGEHLLVLYTSPVGGGYWLERITRGSPPFEAVGSLDSMFPDEFAPADGEPVPWPEMTICSDRSIVVGLQRRYRFVRVGTRGIPLGVSGRQLPRRYMSEADEERVRATLEARAGQMGVPSSLIEESLKRERERPVPHFSGVWGDDRRRLWIDTTRGDSTRSVIDVMTCDGDFLGSVVLRDDVQDLVVRHDTIVALVRRAYQNDQQGIDRYAIQH